MNEIDGVWSRAAIEGRSELTYLSDFPKLQYMYGFMVRCNDLPFSVSFLLLPFPWCQPHLSLLY